MNKRIEALEKEIQALKEDHLDTASLEMSVRILKKDYHSNLRPWDRVLLARDPQRPTALDFINKLFTDFVELDRKSTRLNSSH